MAVVAIAVRTFDDDGTTALQDPADISSIIGHSSEQVWVDVVDATDDEFACLTSEFGLHALAVEDAQNHGQRPKLEHYTNHAFVVAYSKKMAEVDLFIGPTWLVTVRERSPEGEVCHINSIRTRFSRDDAKPTAVGQLVYVVLDELIDGNLERTDEMEDRVEALEERIILDQVGDPAETQTELLHLRRELLRHRKIALPMRDVIVRLQRGEVDWIDGDARERLQDVVDHANRVVEQLDLQQELISNAVEAHNSLLANRMNLVMKRMTSWGAILIASTLIAGIYGMNFEHMPELKWKYGYVWALGLMAIVTLVGYRYFKKKDWL